MAKNNQNEQIVAQLNEISKMLYRIAKNQDVDHETLDNVFLRVRDTQDLSEDMTTQFKLTQQKLHETIGAMSNSLPAGSVQPPVTPIGTAQPSPGSVVNADMYDDFVEEDLEAKAAESSADSSKSGNLVIKLDQPAAQPAQPTPAQPAVVQAQPVPVAQENAVPVDVANSPLMMNMFQKVMETHTSVSAISTMLSEISRMLYDSYRYASPELIATLQSQSPDKKRILIAGFYGAPNLGDELMCLTLLDYLRQYLPDAEFTVMCTNSDSFDYAGAYFGANILHYPRGYYDENVIANSFDALFIGGGALLDDSPAARGRSVPGAMNIGRVAVELPKAFETMNKPVAMLGLSTNNKLDDKAYLKDATDAILGARVTTIRDPYSISVLHKAGVPEERMILCPDIVASDRILLDVVRDTKTLLAADIANGKLSNSSDTKRIMVSWIAYNEEAMPKLAQFVEEIAKLNELEKRDVRVCLVPFLMEFNADEQNALAVRNLLSKGANDILETPEFSLDIGVVCDTITACDYAVNMRYHGAYLASLLGIPGLAVSWDGHRHYPNKMRYLADTFGCTDFTDSSRFDPAQEAYNAFASIFEDDIDKKLEAISPSEMESANTSALEENLFLFPDDDNEDIETVAMVAKSLVRAMEDEFDLPPEALEDPKEFAEQCRRKHAGLSVQNASDGRKTSVDKRIERLSESEKICEDAQAKMDTIMGRLVNSINR